MTTYLNHCAALKIHWLLQEFFDFSDPLINTFRVETVNFVGGFQRTEKNISSDGGAVFRVERINVFLCKKQVTEIEHLQIRLKEFL